MMARLLTVAVVVVVLVEPVRCADHFSYAFGKKYTVAYTHEQMEKCPSWQEDAENPPLSARRVIKLANEMKDSLVKDSETHKWVFRYARLEPARDGKWYWLIFYEAHQKVGMSTGIPHHLHLMVLMDGTAVKPELTDVR